MKFSPTLSAAFLATCLAGCFVDNPDAVAPGVDAGTPADARDAATADAAPPATPLCTKYGGFGTVQAIIDGLFQSLLADCRISKFFSSLTPDRQLHLYDCLVDQVAVVMGCPGIRYDVDSNGVECRDMRASHKGLAIRNEDFDALVGDLVGVLQGLQVEQADIEALAPTLEGLRSDVVTNSAPGLAKPACDAGN